MVSKIDFLYFFAYLLTGQAGLLFDFCYLVIHLISAICKNMSLVQATHHSVVKKSYLHLTLYKNSRQMI